MPTEASSNEPIPPDIERKNQDLSLNGIVWFIRLAAIVYISGIMFRIWDDDEIQLHVLHGITRLLQTTARLVGTWALRVEEKYNKTVDSLH